MLAIARAAYALRGCTICTHKNPYINANDKSQNQKANVESINACPCLCVWQRSSDSSSHSLTFKLKAVNVVDAVGDFLA